MCRLRIALLALALTLGSLGVAHPAYADGIIIPEPPICDPGPCPHPVPLSQLAIKYHHVEVKIEQQVAITRVDQVFRNENDATVEGTYVFPLPAGASVTRFTMWVDGQPVEGKVLTREQARQQYEDIVRRMRDPALLEYIDRGAVQASIFPIEPGGERRIQLEYTQVLTVDNGLVHYTYPLNTEKFSTAPLDDVSVKVDVRSDRPIRAVYSPSHPIDVVRDGAFHVTAGYEDGSVRPNRDFELFYSLSEDAIGFSLMTYRDPSADGGDGYFLLMASPAITVEPSDVIGRDVLLVLDQSGSMEGEKFRQVQAAAKYVLDHLNANDRFNIVAFSTGTRAFADGLRPPEDRLEGERWVDSLSARGATDINRALLEAVAQADSERPAIVLFLTDGLPTEGVTDRQTIIDDIQEASPSNLHLFAFGVGYDVDTLLLDSLAQGHHGATTYVAPGQSIDEAVSSLYAKVSTPVLTDVRLDFGHASTSDLFPEALPDLFAGGELLVVGRYHQPGDTTIRLSGTVDGQTKTFEFTDQSFRESGGPAFLPRLWATRKIGVLLNQIRLQGVQKELVDQVVHLSIRYGIVTPYTSYLVTEPTVLGAAAEGQIAADALKQMQTAPTQSTGQAAVQRAAGESALGGASAPVAPSGQAADVVRVVATRTFKLVDGTWIDTAFDPKTMIAKAVPFLSSDYFALAGSNSELAAAFALGERVIAFSGGVAYEVVAADQPGDAITIPTATGATPANSADPYTAPASHGRPLTTLPCGGALLPLGLAALGLRRHRI